MVSDPLTLTESAAGRLRDLLFQEVEVGKKQPIGIRVSVIARGCSGLSYTLEFAYETRNDEILMNKGVTILVNRLSLFLLIGSEVDFVQDKLHSKFLFRNPNEKGRCGCGESFHTA